MAKNKPKPLNIRTDFEFDFYLTRKNATTRATEAATGLTGVTGRLALLPSGSAVGGCTASLTEAGTTGRYVGIIDTAQLVTDLTNQVGRLVYAIVSKSGDLDGEWEPYLVVDNHQMSS